MTAMESDDTEIPGDCPQEKTIERQWTATDGEGDEHICTQVISVVDDTAPTITPPGPITLECTSHGGVPETHPDVANWLENYVSTDDCGTGMVTDDGPSLFPASCPPGEPTTVTFTATDECGNSNSEASTVTVLDTTAPELWCSVALDTLWPANHQLVDVGLTFTATDICDEAPAIAITVSSDERPDQAVGAGGPNHCPDAVVVEDHSVLLRAERSGAGDGRVYMITVDATDTCGNVGSCQTTVAVPKSTGSGGTAVDSGQVYDASTCSSQLPGQPNVQQYGPKVQAQEDGSRTVKSPRKSGQPYTRPAKANGRDGRESNDD